MCIIVGGLYYLYNFPSDEGGVALVVTEGEKRNPFSPTKETFRLPNPQPRYQGELYTSFHRHFCR